MSLSPRCRRTYAHLRFLKAASMMDLCFYQEGDRNHGGQALSCVVRVRDASAAPTPPTGDLQRPLDRARAAVGGAARPPDLLGVRAGELASGPRRRPRAAGRLDHEPARAHG